MYMCIYILYMYMYMYMLCSEFYSSAFSYRGLPGVGCMGTLLQYMRVYMRILLPHIHMCPFAPFIQSIKILSTYVYIYIYTHIRVCI